MIKWLKENAWAIYLGGAPTFLFDVSLLNYQWWLLMIPISILVSIKD